jgi:hypothetical protein
MQNTFRVAVPLLLDWLMCFGVAKSLPASSSHDWSSRNFLSQKKTRSATLDASLVGRGREEAMNPVAYLRETLDGYR